MAVAISECFMERRRNGQLFIYLRCCEGGQGGEPCAALLGGGAAPSHQAQRAGAPLLYGRGRGAFQTDQRNERKGITVESDQDDIKRRKTGRAAVRAHGGHRGHGDGFNLYCKRRKEN